MLAALLQARHSLPSTTPRWVIDGITEAHALLEEELDGHHRLV